MCKHFCSSRPHDGIGKEGCEKRYQRAEKGQERKLATQGPPFIDPDETPSRLLPPVPGNAGTPSVGIHSPNEPFQDFTKTRCDALVAAISPFLARGDAGLCELVVRKSGLWVNRQSPESHPPRRAIQETGAIFRVVPRTDFRFLTNVLRILHLLHCDAVAVILILSHPTLPGHLYILACVSRLVSLR